MRSESFNGNKNYAEAEWQWYLSGDRNIKVIRKIFTVKYQIWKRMADKVVMLILIMVGNGQRNDQLDYVMMLKA